MGPSIDATLTQVLFETDRSGGVIDATMTKGLADGIFYLVYKNMDDKTLSVASAEDLEGPYATLADDIAPGEHPS